MYSHSIFHRLIFVYENSNATTSARARKREGNNINYSVHWSSGFETNAFKGWQCENSKRDVGNVLDREFARNNSNKKYQVIIRETEKCCSALNFKFPKKKFSCSNAPNWCFKALIPSFHMQHAVFKICAAFFVFCVDVMHWEYLLGGSKYEK